MPLILAPASHCTRISFTSATRILLRPIDHLRLRCGHGRGRQLWTGTWQIVVNTYLVNSDEQNRPHPGKLRRTATSDVASDRLGVGWAVQMILPETKLIRVIDRDFRTDTEIQELAAEGVRVLSRRHLEAYLLDDDVLSELCNKVQQPERFADVLAAKAEAIGRSSLEGNDRDDIKSAAGHFYVAVRKILRLEQPGSNAMAFMRDLL